MSRLPEPSVTIRWALMVGGLALLARFPSDLDPLFGAVLLLVAAAFAWEAWSKRWSRRRLRHNLLRTALTLAGGVMLIEGWLALMLMPLVVLAAVLAALAGAAYMDQARE